MLKLAPGHSTNSYAPWQDATRIGQRGFEGYHTHTGVVLLARSHNPEGGDVEAHHLRIREPPSDVITNVKVLKRRVAPRLNREADRREPRYRHAVQIGIKSELLRASAVMSPKLGSFVPIIPTPDQIDAHRQL